MALNKIYAKMENLQVSWKGEKEKNGKIRKSIQVVTKSPDGVVNSFFMSGNGSLDGIMPGDVLALANVSIRSYKDNLYIDLVSSEKATKSK